MEKGISAFPSLFLQYMFSAVEFIIRPYMWCLTGAVGPFLPTTVECRYPYKLAVQRVLFAPLYTIGAVLFLPVILFAFFLRNMLHQFRRPFCLSVEKSRVIPPLKSAYSVATANLCLMPEILSKFNNLDDTSNRAIKIGERIIIDQTFYTGMMESLLSSSEHTVNGVLNQNEENQEVASSIHQHYNEKQTSDKLLDMKVDVIAHFPRTDFLCLQETFDRDFSKLLVAELHKVYPWIVYDVGYHSPRLNYCGLNSGLMLASRYEILDVRFNPFTKRCGFCTIVGKGLLMVKVCVRRKEHDRRDVGYMFNTHLQAFQGDNPIVVDQLSEILQWSSEFRADTAQDGDDILFDILCGDFNIDNMSPGEVHIADHELFETYVDVCRERPGKDYDWTVGTELRTPLLHEEAISTPEGLKAAIEDPYLRQSYLIDADIESATMDSIYNAVVKKDEQGNVILSPVGGRRRIDMVLYRKNSHVVVQNYNIVTRLASLTDHIPVSATFICQN